MSVSNRSIEHFLCVSILFVEIPILLRSNVRMREKPRVSISIEPAQEPIRPFIPLLVLNLPERAVNTYGTGKPWNALPCINTHPDRCQWFYSHYLLRNKENHQKIRSIRVFFLIYFLSILVDYNCWIFVIHSIYLFFSFTRRKFGAIIYTHFDVNCSKIKLLSAASRYNFHCDCHDHDKTPHCTHSPRLR